MNVGRREGLRGYRSQQWGGRLERGQGRGGGPGLGVCHLHKVGVFGISDSDHGVHLLDQLLFLIVIKLHVPFGQACLARPVLDEDEADLGAARGGSENVWRGAAMLHLTAPPIATRERRAKLLCCLPPPGPSQAGLDACTHPRSLRYPCRGIFLPLSGQLCSQLQGPEFQAERLLSA